MVKACISPGQAYMVLLKEAKLIRDYRLISMVHSFFKLFIKVLARLANAGSECENKQSAFIMIISVRCSLQPNYYTNRTTGGHKCSLED